MWAAVACVAPTQMSGHYTAKKVPLLQITPQGGGRVNGEGG